MSLQSVYKQFLAAPNSALLATDATLHYITTTTTFRSAAEVIKHLSSQRNQIKKKKEDVLIAIEADNVVAIEFDTAIEFVISGGTYLPGLDDNFLADRTVNLPIVRTRNPSCCGQLTNTPWPLDAHNHLRRQGQNRTDSSKLGPRSYAETG